jgi:hypothetical protein
MNDPRLASAATVGTASTLWADFEAFEFFGAFHHDGLLFVGLEHEVGAGAGDASEGGEFFGDELGDFTEITALDENEEVVAAGHEEKGSDFVELGDTAGDAIEAAFAFGLDLDFDDGFDEVSVDFVVVDDRLVAEDDFVVLVLLDAARDLVGGEVEHLGQIGGRSQRVFFEKF